MKYWFILLLVFITNDSYGKGMCYWSKLQERERCQGDADIRLSQPGERPCMGTWFELNANFSSCADVGLLSAKFKWRYSTDSGANWDLHPEGGIILYVPEPALVETLVYVLEMTCGDNDSCSYCDTAWVLFSDCACDTAVQTLNKSYKVIELGDYDTLISAGSKNCKEKPPSVRWFQDTLQDLYLFSRRETIVVNPRKDTNRYISVLTCANDVECSDTDTVVIVLSTTDVNNMFSQELVINNFTNPVVTNNFVINLTSPENDVITLNWFDINGRKIGDSKTLPIGYGLQNLHIETPIVPSGVYILTINDDETQIPLRLAIFNGR